MYLVEDEPFQQARSIVSALAKELAEQEASRFGRPVDLRKVIRHAAGAERRAGHQGFGGLAAGIVRRSRNG